MSITAIWGPPQSGKTTLAIDLAHALSQHGKAVCLISPEPYSELTARMNIRITREKSLTQALQALGNLKQSVTEADSLLFVLGVPWDTDAFDEEPNELNIKALFEQAEAAFDCVLVDCPSGNGNAIAARALGRASKVVLLSGGSGVAAMWYGAFRRSIESLAQRTVYVCNKVAGCYDYLTLYKLIRKSPEVFVPYFQDIASIQSTKRTLYGSASKTGRAYTQSIDTLIEKLEVTED